MPDRPNVVLFCVDQWRGDCLSVAGHSVVHTPYLDQMALDGARFHRAYSACPSCIPARAGYYGHMTHIDHQINRFLEVLQEFGLRDHTYLCFVSDHGEMMGDHHLYRKSLPYEGSARVPLILQGPRDSGIQRGQAIDPVTELRDVMPTLLECAGLPVPESVEGRSFLPLARGERIEWRPHLHGEHTYGGQSVQWLTDGREKYVWFSGTGHEQLFNLEEDPQELHDLARSAAAAERVAPWRQRLMEALAGRGEEFTDGQRLIPGRPVRPLLSHVRPAG